MDEILYGAEPIGVFLWPSVSPKRRKRRVYHLAKKVPKADRLPVFMLGSTICARPETVRAWIEEREKRAPAGSTDEAAA